jgi:hypothetical protein
MNPVGALKMNIIICFRHLRCICRKSRRGNGLLLACATSASRIRLWPVCSHYESFSALEIVDSRLSLVGEVSWWLPADRPAALSGLEFRLERDDLGAETESRSTQRSISSARRCLASIESSNTAFSRTSANVQVWLVRSVGYLGKCK